MSGVRPQSAAGSFDVVSSSVHRVDVPPLSSSSTSQRLSPRPATAGFATARSGIPSLTPRQTGQVIDSGPNRDATIYFESFKKEELRELIAQSTASWLLSPDFRGQAGLPCGIASSLTLEQKPHMTLLFPKENNTPRLEYREIHQIIRELTAGIFGVNQMPCLRLDPNFDLSSTIRLPLAYKDTKVGHILISLDYAMKSLWHGACVARSKRSKLSEKWRTLLDVNSATGEFNASSKKVFGEFTAAGQEFITKNPHFKTVYDELNKVDPSEADTTKEKKFFNTYSDFIRCVMSFTTIHAKWSSSENVIAFDSIYEVTSAITLPDDDFIAPAAHQRLRRRLRHQLKMIRSGLLLDPTTRRNLALLKFISTVSVILVALRRRLMRVPDIDGFLSELSGDVVRTDSELPPFAIGEFGDHPCETFTVDARGERKVITHAHGEIQFDAGTCQLESLSDENWCSIVQKNAMEHLASIMQDRPKPEYDVPTVLLDGKEHYVVYVPLTTYYPVSPPLPNWLHARYQLLSSLRPRKLPMNDLQLAEMFKQVFGFRKALANKNADASLRLSACRGLVAPFIALMRKIASSSLFSADLQGFTLVHHACIHNRIDILSILLSQKPNLSTRRTEINKKSKPRRNVDPQIPKELNEEKTGGTALLFAARCGALQCVNALLASKANPRMSDALGRSCIHHAASADQTPIVRAILRKYPNLLESSTTGGENATPLLIAASSGALLTLKFLIEKGANIAPRDINGDGVIERAALNFHADVIEHFIEEVAEVANADKVKVWKTMVDLLNSSSIVRQDASLRCLEVLLHHHPEYWQPLQVAGAVTPLVKLLRCSKRRPKSASAQLDAGYRSDESTTPPIRSLACSVMCLMSEQDSVRREIAATDAIPTLIGLLRPVQVPTRTKHIQYTTDVESEDERFELQSRSSVVLSDLAHVNASRIADHGGIPPLVDLLQLDVVDVLVNVVTTLAALCRGDTSREGDIQGRIMECGAATSLVDFLGVRDDALQTVTADAIAAICDGNINNQDEFVSLAVLDPLVAILRGHCISAQTKAALAVDCITMNNPVAQSEAVMKGAPTALCRLFQIWSDNVKERGACALWALAGSHPMQQRVIANRIGTTQIIEMLISKSDILQWIGCQAATAISSNQVSGQTRLAESGAVPPLIRLLRLDRTSRRVIMASLEAMRSMCIGVAHLNNRKSQQLIAEEGAIGLLVDRIWQTTRDEAMQVDLLLCLACVVTGSLENEEKLNNIDVFGYEIILELLNSFDVSVKCRAALALALFAFNRLPQQQKILKLGGVPFSIFDSLLESKNENIQAAGAFQLVVLARVISHTTVVDASARGIITLVQLLDSVDDDVIAVTAGYLASLAHTRAGVPEAIVTSGAVSKLLFYLKSENDLVRIASAQALGYLSFNRTASRELMMACRAAEGVYESLIENMGENGRISEEFVAEFKRQSIIGLPIPKGPSPQRRPMTASGDHSPTTGLKSETKASLRQRSASPVPHILVTEFRK